MVQEAAFGSIDSRPPTRPKMLWTEYATAHGCPGQCDNQILAGYAVYNHSADAVNSFHAYGSDADFAADRWAAETGDSMQVYAVVVTRAAFEKHTLPPRIYTREDLHSALREINRIAFDAYCATHFGDGFYELHLHHNGRSHTISRGKTDEIVVNLRNLIFAFKARDIANRTSK